MYTSNDNNPTGQTALCLLAVSGPCCPSRCAHVTRAMVDGSPWVCATAHKRLQQAETQSTATLSLIEAHLVNSNIVVLQESPYWPELQALRK